MMPKRPDETLFTDGERWFTFKHQLPSFWNDKISKGMAKLSNIEAARYAQEMMKRRPPVPVEQVLKALKMRGRDDWDETDLLRLREDPRTFLYGCQKKDEYESGS